MVQSGMKQQRAERRLAIEGGEPLYRKSHFRPHPIPEEGRAAAAEVLQSGRLFRYAGEEVTRMEHDWARYFGVRFALAVSSASSAIELALLATGLERGGDVPMPAFTFSAVPSATVHAGGRPILVEVGDDYTIDFDDLAARLTPRSRHLLLTHMRGHVCDMDAIRAFCAERKLVLIEDAAHALGVRWDDQHAGTMGLVGCYSFQSDKIINGGEGGLLITNDEDVIVRATLYSGCYERYWSQHGYGKLSFPDLQRQLPLYNMRMTNLAAVLIASQIGVLEERVAQCAANHRLLVRILAESPHVRLPSRSPRLRPVLDTIQFTLVGLDEGERREFARAVQMEGIGLTIFGLDPNNARAFWNWEYLGVTPHLPRTEAMLKATCDLRLPATLSSDEIAAIGGVLLDALDHATAHRRAERREVG